MHYLVRLIVEAKDVQEASTQAENVMMELVEEERFDWYQDGAEGSRWEDCWKPVRLCTEEGQALVKDALDEQLDRFNQAIEVIRYMVDNYTDDQIFNEEFDQDDSGKGLSRFQFSKVSGCHGNACQLFDTDGGLITNQKELNLYLNEMKGLWVVQVDCHY